VKYLRFIFVPIFSALLVVSSAGATTRPLVSAYIMQKVERVHICEERGYGWHVDGPVYFGGLGWKVNKYGVQQLWLNFKPPRAPQSMADATPFQQAWAEAHFIGSVFHGWWPDQVGCTGGY
jgi:hypothetical protein